MTPLSLVATFRRGFTLPVQPRFGDARTEAADARPSSGPADPPAVTVSLGRQAPDAGLYGPRGVKVRGAESGRAVDEATRRRPDESPATDAETAARPRGADGDPLSEAELEQVRSLKRRDQEVRAHEQAHKAVGGPHAGSISYEYDRGPDGKRYAVGGEVPIDVSEVPDDPKATIAKMQVVRRAALAPAQPSAQDRRVAAEASAKEQKARIELRAAQAEAAAEPKATEARGEQPAEAGAEKPTEGPAEPKTAEAPAEGAVEPKTAEASAQAPAEGAVEPKTAEAPVEAVVEPKTAEAPAEPVAEPKLVEPEPAEAPAPAETPAPAGPTLRVIEVPQPVREALVPVDPSAPKLRPGEETFPVEPIRPDAPGPTVVLAGRPDPAWR